MMFHFVPYLEIRLFFVFAHFLLLAFLNQSEGKDY